MICPTKECGCVILDLVHKGHFVGTICVESSITMVDLKKEIEKVRQYLKEEKSIFP